MCIEGSPQNEHFTGAPVFFNYGVPFLNGIRNPSYSLNQTLGELFKYFKKLWPHFGQGGHSPASSRWRVFRHPFERGHPATPRGSKFFVYCLLFC